MLTCLLPGGRLESTVNQQCPELTTPHHPMTTCLSTAPVQYQLTCLLPDGPLESTVDQQCPAVPPQRPLALP